MLRHYSTPLHWILQVIRDPKTDLARNRLHRRIKELISITVLGQFANGTGYPPRPRLRGHSISTFRAGYLRFSTESDRLPPDVPDTPANLTPPCARDRMPAPHRQMGASTTNEYPPHDRMGDFFRLRNRRSRRCDHRVPKQFHRIHCGIVSGGSASRASALLRQLGVYLAGFHS